MAEIATKPLPGRCYCVKFRDMFPLSRRAALLWAGFHLVCAASFARAAEPPLAIRGYDPVAYFTLQRASPGAPQFAFDWDEQRWLFVSAGHRDAFKADPARYAPQFASYCAMALSRGEVQAANPEYWLISDGKLYLFGKAAGPEKFRADPGLRQKAEKTAGERGALAQPAQRE